jgi:hypothetical protein
LPAVRAAFAAALVAVARALGRAVVAGGDDAVVAHEDRADAVANAVGAPAHRHGNVHVVVDPVRAFATLLVYSALTYAVGMAYSGAAPAVGDSLGTGLRKWLPLAIATVLSYFAIMLGLILFIIPGLILLAMFFAVHPAVVLEGRGPISAMGRSRELSRGARMRILGIIVVAWIITLLPAIAMWTVAGVSAGMGALAGELVLGTGNLWLQGLLQAAGLIISAVTAPFLIIITVLLYYDRRARTEAPDLEAAADALTQTR